MSFNTKKINLFSRRAFVVLIFKLIGSSIILSRFFYLQIVKYTYFDQRSKRNKLKQIHQLPARGTIMDKNGIVIASVRNTYAVIFKKQDKKQDYEEIETFVKMIKLSPEDRKVIVKNYNRDHGQEIIIYNYMTREQIVDFEFYTRHLKNMFIYTYLSRYYVDAFSFSHIIGYLAYPSKGGKKQVSNNYLHNKIGKRGLEKVFNHSLTGKYGLKIVEVDAIGKKTKDIKYVAPVKGNTLQTSIDYDLQRFTYLSALGTGFNSSVVVMDVNTGEVLTMVSTPSFNINTLSTKTTNDTFKRYQDNRNKPFQNRAIQSIYAPGSIFKIITALAALEDGFDPNTEFYCRGHKTVHRKRKHCWKKSGHKSLDLSSAIKNSCNIYFYDLILQMNNPEKMKEIANMLSFGSAFEDFELPSQAKGIVPNDSWKRKVFNESWMPGDSVNMAIGQGFIGVNCLQLSTMMSRLASLGNEVQPTLIKQEKQKKRDKILINPSNIQFILDAVFRVTNEIGGTAYYSGIRRPNMELSGKTGTAQVVSQFQEEYTNKASMPHGLFAGFAPFTNPQFSIASICEHGVSGSRSAARLSKKIMLYHQLRVNNYTKKADSMLRKATRDALKVSQDVATVDVNKFL